MLDHIVLISIDTLRSDLLSASRGRLFPEKHEIDWRPVCPSLDDLAARSTLFTNCITAAPYTSAAHASFFTGLWPLRHGVFEFFNRPLEPPTIFTRARQLGYRTVFKVDFPIILGPYLGFDRDVDDYLIEDDGGFLEKLRAADRTVSFAHFGGLHIPYGFHNLAFGGEAYRAKVEELEATVPDLGPPPLDQVVETYLGAEDRELLLRYKRIVQHCYRRREYSRLFGLYLDGAQYFFEHRFSSFMERLLECLEGTRFLLVLFGDHGEEYDAESYGHFNSLAEGVLRVPVLFHGEGARPGVHDRRVRSIDVLPSILDMLGDSEHVLQLDGRSLADTIRSGTDYEEREAYAQTYVPETQEFLDYQKELLRLGRRHRPLDHVLYKEAVYAGPYKLQRQLHEYDESSGGKLMKCRPRQRLEWLSPHGRPEPIDESIVAQDLSRLLDEYGRRRTSEAARLAVPEEIRAKLQDIGYRI